MTRVGAPSTQLLVNYVRSVGALVFVASTTLSSTALADDVSPSLWDPAWPRVGWIEVGASAVVAGGAFAATAAIDTSGPPKWTHGVWFDDGARNALVAGPAGVDRASGVSDVMLDVLLVAPFASAAATWGFRHDRDTALQLVIIDAEAYALTEATVGLMKSAIRRERPDAAADGCERRPSDPDCAKRVGKNSFPSNHAGSSFVAASLLCTEHLHVGIAGAPWDATICATSLAAATSVSLLRVVADKHYVSDIVVGGAIGAAYGWLMPTLLHFHGAAPARTTAAGHTLQLASIQPMISPTVASIGATFVF